MPAVGFEHGAVHLSVQFAQALDIFGGLAAIVEAIVGLCHALVAGDHQRGAVSRGRSDQPFPALAVISKPTGKGKVSKQSDGV